MFDARLHTRSTALFLTLTRALTLTLTVILILNLILIFCQVAACEVERNHRLGIQLDLAVHSPNQAA